jgi:hypothetical protein
VVDAFKIQAQWPARQPNARDKVDATFCNLKICVNEENVTAYQTEGGVDNDHLELPSYYLAEWVAENWWPLLWEPCKSEDAAGDPTFRTRHLISVADHGFVLPNLNIVPTGENIHIFANAREAKYADARFRRTADALVDRSQVEFVLKDFVQRTVARLGGSGAETPLQAAWSLVTETDAETSQFCRLIGALGLSPYDKHDNVERALDGAARVLSEDQLLDLCLTATPENIVRAAFAAATMQRAIEKGAEIDLSPLPESPADRPSLPAWKFGYGAARTLRDHFSIGEKDIGGASLIFEKLHVGGAAKHEIDLRGVESPIVGGVQKRKSHGRMIITADSRQARQFANARATFFLLIGRDKESRLITGAVTRDQQASRAFAAELLVPQAFVRSQADGNRLKWGRVNEIAAEADVSPEVVSLQASNIGLQLVH